MPLLAGATADPVLTWELDRDALELDGRPLAPRALFIRHDIFTNMADGRDVSAHRAYAWFTTLLSWAAAHQGVRLFNRQDRKSVV